MPRGLHGQARRDTLLHPIPLDPLPLISQLRIPSLWPAPSSTGEALNANEQQLCAARDVAVDELVVARQWQAGAWRGCGTGNGPGPSHCVGQMSPCLALRVRTPVVTRLGRLPRAQPCLGNLRQGCQLNLICRRFPQSVHFHTALCTVTVPPELSQPIL